MRAGRISCTPSTPLASQHRTNPNTTLAFLLEQDTQTEVALEACEFWLAFADQPQANVYLGPYLPQLIPILLNGMCYSPDDLLILKADEV